MEINMHIKTAIFQMNDCSEVKIKDFSPIKSNSLGELNVTIALLQKAKNIQINAEELEEELKKKELLVNDQTYIDFTFKGLKLELKIKLENNIPYGLITDETLINFKKEQSNKF